MTITEGPVPDSIRKNLPGVESEGAAQVGVSADGTPADIVAAINEFVGNPSNKISRGDNWVDRALPIGMLWGQQLVREFGWEWASVTFHEQGDSKAVGVFSNDRSLSVYPFHFIFGCFENDAPVTVLLAFNMLKDRQIPELPPNGFENLMDRVHYIVPPS